jgi:NADPH-dependent 2,4-dienoyl-CoA reductase/sulfur reductase-like enzyme
VDHVVVVGAGLAGVRSIEALRAHGFTGRVTLIGEEPHRPYDRPPLSKAVLLGETDSTVVDSDLDALNVRLSLGTAAKGLRAGVLETTEGELEYDGLVIATGTTSVRLRGEGRQHVLRTIDDALELRSRLVPGARIVVIGAGWIGAEVATAAAKEGCRVTVLEAGQAPLAVALGPAAGAFTAPWYGEAGVELRLGASVASVDPDAVVLTSGERIPADTVVTGVGVRPAIEWLRGSPVELGDGVLVDEHLRTSLPNVVAVGDCANWWSRRFGRRLRVEHWDTALGAPDTAAATLLGEEAVYDPVPYFWSDQFGRMVQYAGHHGGGHPSPGHQAGGHLGHPGAGQPGGLQPGGVQPGGVQPGGVQSGIGTPADGRPGGGAPGGGGEPGNATPDDLRMILRGDPAADRKWSICWLTGEDRLAAILTVDRPRDLVQGRRLVEAGRRVRPDKVADLGVPLRDCALP